MSDGNPKMFSRRNLLRFFGAAACLPLCRSLFSQAGTSQQLLIPAHPPSPTSLAPEDDQLLDDLEKANFQFFWEQADPKPAW